MDPLEIIAGGSSAVGNILNGIIGNNTSKKAIKAQQEMNKRNIAAQERINAANVASQEKINQQNIDFQNRINALMRSDSNSQHTREVRDLKSAGLSAAAAADKGGFSPASLSSPDLGVMAQAAPQVSSEMPDSVVAAQSALGKSISDSMNTVVGSIIDSKVKAADEKNKAAAARYADDYWKKTLSKFDADIQSSIAAKGLSEEQAKKVKADTDNVKEIFKQLEIQTHMLSFDNEKQQEKFFREMESLLWQINLYKSQIRNNDSSSRLNDLKSDFQDITNKFARLGINFNGSGMFDSLARLATSGNLDTVLDSVYDGIDTILDSLADHVQDVLPSLLVGGAARFIKNPSRYLTGGSRSRRLGRSNKKPNNSRH